MTMTCQKTGCIGYLEEYGEYFIGDAFHSDGVFVFRIAGTSRTNPRGDIVHYTVHDSDQWFDKINVRFPGQTSTLVSTRVVFHGYEGVKMEDR
jgi:hypothetical protein